jgi:DNA-binding NtrC family response regulator
MDERLKILVVDDNTEFCENIKDLLEHNDFEVMTAYDAMKGLEIIKNHGADLVLLDVHMPKLGGIEAFRKMKDAAPLTPIIMVTGHEVEDQLRATLREGAYGALSKPFDFDIGKLGSRIEKAVSRNPSILIVDEDRDVSSAIDHALKNRGYSVSVAVSCSKAIRYAREDHFDIMLIDMKLPQWESLGTYFVIRDARPNLNVIVLTSQTREFRNLVKGTLNDESFAILEKPVEVGTLISLFDDIVEQKTRENHGALTRTGYYPEEVIDVEHDVAKEVRS